MSTNSAANDGKNAKMVIPPKKVDTLLCVPAASFMGTSKNDLQEQIQKMGIELPVYKNESFGEAHSLRWSATILFKNGSSVSVARILKTKKDADKAVSYKALRYGVERLLSEKIVIPGDIKEDSSMLMESNASKPIEALSRSSKPEKPEKSEKPEKPEKPDSVALNTIPVETHTIDLDQSTYSTSKQLLDVASREEKYEVPDFVSVVAAECLCGRMQKRCVFGYGDVRSWEEACFKLFGLCIRKGGVVVVSSSALLEMVKKQLQLIRPALIFDTLTKPTEESEGACLIESQTLRLMKMEKLFPTERPILIMDASPQWSVTWEWLSYLPTFCIASFCVYESAESSPIIQLSMLRDNYNCDLFTHS